MVSNWKALLIKCRHEPRIVPILLALLRLCICFLPQLGYLHPDEFFQASDFVGGKHFNSKIQLVWEFKTDRPIRSMLIPNLLQTIAFKLATLLQAKPSAYLLIIAPRFVYTLLSFSVDFCLYKLCQFYSSRGLWYLPISVIFQSSFVCLNCLTRTLSNVPEVVIFATLLVVVCHTIKPRFKILFVTPSGRSTPVREQVKGSKQLVGSLLVGFLVTLGTFNRPTFPCFALVPCLYWLLQSFKRNSFNPRLTIQKALAPLLVASTFTALLLSAYDTFYYKGTESLQQIIKLLINFDFGNLNTKLADCWTMTPYNFIVYNTNVDNLSKYTLHPPYTHILVNIPLAFNILGLLFYWKLVNLLIGKGIYWLLFNTHRIYAMMLLSTLTSIILLSFVPHQEFRFLLPLIVPLVYVFAFNIYVSNKWLSSWLLINALLVYFYTSIHQAGVTHAALKMDPILKSYMTSESGDFRVNVVALRCYLVPSYQWNIPANDDRFNFDLQDTFMDPNSSLELKLNRIVQEQQLYPSLSHKLYVMLPTIYKENLSHHLMSRFSINSTMIDTVEQYSPHFSGEDLQESIAFIKQRGLGKWRQAFGFSLMEVNLENQYTLEQLKPESDV